jgi:hypothetical protein
LLLASNQLNSVAGGSIAGGSDRSASFLQDMFIKIYKDKAYTFNVDLYFSALVVDWHSGSGKDDLD